MWLIWLYVTVMRIPILRRALVAGVALSLLPFAAAQASSIVTFDWVSTSASGGSTTPNGALTLTLPGTITTQTFDSGNLGSSALAAADISAFSFEYSDGLSVGLSNLTARTVSPEKSGDWAWYTSDSVTPSGGPTGIYLITGFTLSGSKVFPGDPRAANFSIANTAGQLTLIAPASNGITPFAGQGVASSDAGYWELSSIQTVPLPATLWLFASGIVGLGRWARKTKA
jgi:hypothetical protein